MHLWQATVPFCLLASAALPTAAASAWRFTDATVAVQPKGAGINGGFKEEYARSSKCLSYLKLKLIGDPRFSSSKPLASPVAFTGADTLRVTLTTQEGSSAKRPHQAFLLLKDGQTGLDVSYPFTVKENGKSRLELVLSPLLRPKLSAAVMS